MNYIEITDERFNKGLRIRHRVFNETEFSETNIVCRNAACSRIKQTRIVTVNNVDEVSFEM